MINRYYSTDKTQLSPHFNLQEFKCKCGAEHEIVVNTDLVEKLEKLYSTLDCSKIIINSGYRCYQHDINVGGNGYGQHTKGNAADIKCYDKNGKIISTKIIACKAQDIGFNGIGNIDDSYTAIHVDVRTSNRWYGDEAIHYYDKQKQTWINGTTQTITNDYYSFYGVARESTSNSDIKALQTALNTLGGKLIVDGIAGQKTLAECHKTTSNIAKGKQNELVKWVQNRLNTLGFDCGKADGIAGNRTMQAIYSWQKQNKLGVGYLGGSDWDKLIS